MQKYEITFIVGEEFAEPKAKEIAKGVLDLITSHGGKVDKEVFWGKRKLAYKIEKSTFGYYFILVFDAESSVVAELTRELNLNEKIMRFLITDFVEKTSFFEEFSREKEGGEEKPRGRRDQERAPREEAREEIKKTNEVNLKKENKAEPEVKKQEAEKDVLAEEVKEEPEPEAKAKEVVEEKEIEDDSAEEEVEEKEEKRVAMTEDERKAKLDEKLAELLKEEE